MKLSRWFDEIRQLRYEIGGLAREMRMLNINLPNIQREIKCAYQELRDANQLTTSDSKEQVNGELMNQRMALILSAVDFAVQQYGSDHIDVVKEGDSIHVMYCSHNNSFSVREIICGEFCDAEKKKLINELNSQNVGYVF